MRPLHHSTQATCTDQAPDFLTLQTLANLLGYKTVKSVRHWARAEGMELQHCGGRTGLFRRRYERWLAWKQGS